MYEVSSKDIDVEILDDLSTVYRAIEYFMSK